MSMANLDLLVLSNAVREDDGDTVRHILMDQHWFARERIISEGENQTLLLLACRNNAVQVAQLLVKQFGVDVMETGDIQSEEKPYEGVSPLWCAAGEGNLPIASYLIDHGAQVNQLTVTKSTPLRSACYNNKLHMVKYLIEKKAEIDLSKNDGSTSLMVAAYHGHYEIVKLLINSGANVNLQDDLGATALNDACRQGHEEIVKLLLEAGADVNLEGKHGVTALGDACRHGNLNIIRKLLDLEARPGLDERGMTPIEVAAENGHEEVIITWVCREQCTRQQRVEALELLGAYFMGKRDYEKMYCYMMKAMKDRATFNLPKQILPPIDAYDNRKECETVEELLAIATDIEALQYQAVILRERILGKRKMDEFPIALLGAMHADTHNYDKCMSLWRRALYHLKKNGDSLTHRLVAFCEVFSEILVDNGSLNREMVMDITNTAIEEIELSRTRLNEGSSEINRIERRTEDYQQNICVSLWLLKLVHHMAEAELYSGQVLRLAQAINRLAIRCSPNNKPLLHVILDETTPCGDFPLDMFVCFPDLALLKQMVLCAVDLCQMDDLGNTALHVLASNCSAQVLGRHRDYYRIIQLLLEGGVHFDQANCMNQIPQEMGSQVVADILQSFFPIPSLQCLSARVIRRSKCNYHNYLSTSLAVFVGLHKQ